MEVRVRSFGGSSRIAELIYRVYLTAVDNQTADKKEYNIKLINPNGPKVSQLFSHIESSVTVYDQTIVDAMLESTYARLPMYLGQPDIEK